MTVRLAIGIAHAAFDESRHANLRRLVDDLETQYDPYRGEDRPRFYLHVQRELERRGHMPPWLACCKWALATEERHDCTHLVFLPDDAILCSDFVSVMTRIVSARPRDLLCCLGNHADAELALVHRFSRKAWVEARRAEMIERLRSSKADDRTILITCDLFDERYGRLLASLTRETPYPFYSTPDGSCLFGGVIPLPLLREHLEWRRTFLQPAADAVTANDEGLNLWAISTGRPVYKPLPSPTQHDPKLPSLCGHDGQEIGYGRRSRIFAGDMFTGNSAYDWSRWNRSDEASDLRLPQRFPVTIF